MQIAEPFHLLHHPSDDTWSLTLSDMDWRHLHSLFDALGFEGNGYLWEGIVQLAVGNELPEIADDLDYDCEGGMFCVVSAGPEPLRRLHGVLHRILNNPDEVRTLLTSVDRDFFDD
ncbi:Imm51 family immunity protein [Embleya sp. NPDC056575]|uniref:Imm51 family immunity protein n=1 Tax=unclassified Embleya TaxID=2699296 RepID=UPI003692479F